MSWFVDLRIARKLALAFGVCLSLALITGAVAVVRMVHMYECAEQLKTDGLDGTATIAQIVSQMKTVRIWQIRTATASDTAMIEKCEKLFEDAAAKVDEGFTKLEGQSVDPAEKREVAELKSRWESYMALAPQYRACSIRGNLPATNQFMADVSYPAYAPVEEQFEKLLQWNRDRGEALMRETSHEFAAARAWVVGLLAAAMIVGIAAAAYITRLIAGNLEQMTGVAKALSEGDTSRDFQYVSRDEIGHLAAAFREMTSYMREMADAATTIAQGNLAIQVSPAPSAIRWATRSRR